MKAVGMDHAFVEDHSVSFGFFNRFQGFDVGVTFDLVGIVYGDDSGFVEGYSDFDDDVAFETGKAQLTLSSRVEGESAYLTFHFPLFGSVPIILGTGRNKLDDVVPGFQFAGEFAEVIAGG